ncbi:MAG: hypothetical protein RQ752_05295 [Thermohalobaculum sp.]|nr:hypothetical protein [Thermohalobaculum sp.]
MKITRNPIALAIAAALLAGGTARAGSVVIDALSIWSATGTVIRTGPDQSVFAGEVSGPYIVDAGQGPVPAGRIVCVGTVSAEISTGRQSAEGQCQITAEDGATSFARFTCEGLRLVGCAGPFEITGGEGRLEGITGSGRMVVRRSKTEFSVSGGVLREEGFGVASWDGLTIELPGAD